MITRIAGIYLSILFSFPWHTFNLASVKSDITYPGLTSLYSDQSQRTFSDLVTYVFSPKPKHFRFLIGRRSLPSIAPSLFEMTRSYSARKIFYRRHQVDPRKLKGLKERLKLQCWLSLIIDGSRTITGTPLSSTPHTITPTPTLCQKIAQIFIWYAFSDSGNMPIWKASCGGHNRNHLSSYPNFPIVCQFPATAVKVGMRVASNIRIIVIPGESMVISGVEEFACSLLIEA